MTGKKRAALAALLIVQLLFAVLFAVLIVRRDASPIVTVPELSFWNSLTMQGQPEDGLLHADAAHLISDMASLSAKDTATAGQDGRIRAFSGPNGTWDAGGYTITVDYEADSPQYITCTALHEGTLLSGEVRLDPAQTQVSFDVLALDRIEEFLIHFEYTGEGSLTVHRVEIRTNSAVWRILLTLWIFLCLAADLILLNRKAIARSRGAFLAIIGIILLTSLPALTGRVGYTDDLHFHLLRLKSLAEAVRLGQLPMRIASETLNGLGYAAPLYYSDLLLLLPAWLMTMGFPMGAAYLCYIVFINSLTAVFGYAAFRGIFQRKDTALLLTLLWCTASYRLCDLWTRGALGEYSAMAFLPLIALAFTKTIREDRFSLKTVLLTAFSMSGILLTHLLTLEMSVIILAAAMLLTVRRSFRPKALMTWAAAAMLTVLLCAWFLVPLVQCYGSLPIALTAEKELRYSLIQSNGASLIDLLDFFRDPWSAVRGDLRSAEVLKTPGLMLMAALPFGLWMAVKRRDRKALLPAVGSVLLLWLSTSLFPWNAMVLKTPFGTVTNAVQFPWRYIAPASLMLCLLLGRALETQSQAKQLVTAAACIAVLLTLSFTAQWHAGARTVDSFSPASLDTLSPGDSEYVRVVPEDASRPGWGVTAEKRGHAGVTLISREGTVSVFSVQTGTEEASADLPLLRYPGYLVTDESGTAYSASDSEDGLIRVILPAGFDGQLTVRYEEPPLWKACTAVSLIAAALSLILTLIIHRKERSSC